MNVSFVCSDSSMPRTIYYDLFANALGRNPRFIADSARADVNFPAEDITLETNWPRFGKQESSFLRGGFDKDSYNAYCDVLLADPRRLCVVNMHPFIEWPQLMAGRSNIYVAHISLAGRERLCNPRTISMPALPLAAGPATIAPKTVLASFRGILSHPVRDKLRAIHDGIAIRCELVARSNHVGRIDASAGKVDKAYVDLLAASTFAFVPRGDALFSYRLLEAMSFGCIPVVLSDDWVLPFDRIIDWSNVVLHPAENDVPNLPGILRSFDAERVAAMQQRVIDTYGTYFASIEVIVETLLQELAQISGGATYESG